MAENGRGFVNPNPLVGSLIVYNNQILAEGWHKGYGLAHAERMAIDLVQNKELLKDSTLYVTLEPCSHFGKTPPCANYILEHHIPEVVVSVYDPNPLVSGKGIQLLKENGVKVTVGLGREQAAHQNRYFLTFHSQKRPFIHLKWAESADGFVAHLPKQRTQISGEEAYRNTHKLRQSMSAVLVGVGTWQIDQPQLTDRVFGGPQPIRIVLDPLNSGDYSNAISASVKTWVINQHKTELKGNCEWISVEDCANSLDGLMNVLCSRNINSLLVEGGANTLNRFLSHNLYDEITVYKSKMLNLTNGLRAPIMDFGNCETLNWEDDVCYTTSKWVVPTNV